MARKLLRKLFDIQDGEGLRALLMFCYIFLVIASLLIVKPVRNSLFLTRFGAAQLPYVFILVAMTAALVTTLYARLARRFRLNYLILSTTLISIASLAVFWLLLFFEYQGGWFIYLFYVWVAIFGVITTSQFWLLANYVFNAREAKRLFGFIGAGAISGGIFGGYLTNYLAPLYGTDNLLFLCMLFLVLCLVILGVVWRKSARKNYRERLQQQKRIRQAESTDNPLRLILESRHLTYIMSIIGVSVIVANLVDYQYSAVASEQITNEDELTAFFGFWLSNLSIFSLAIQLFLTSRVLKAFGVSTSLFFLPIGILIGAVAILVQPALWAAVLIKVSEGGFKQSINKAGLELLALPIPSDVKNQTKTFIDVFVDSLATGLGGLLLIIFTGLLGLSTGQISLIVIALIGVWIYLLVQVRSTYIESFRLALERRTIDVDEENINLEDASVSQSIIKVLDGDNERQILYILKLIEHVKITNYLPYLIELVNHPSDEVKAAAIKLIRCYGDASVMDKVRPLVTHPDQDIQVEALRFLFQHEREPVETIHFYLQHDDYRVQSAALLCAAYESLENAEIRQVLKQDYFARLKQDLAQIRQAERSGQDQIDFMKVNMARAIGILREPALFPDLQELLADTSTPVLKAAVKSAGQLQDAEFVPALIDHLNTKFVRSYAREALAEYGEAVIEPLTTVLVDPEQPEKRRLAIPRVLSMIGSQKAVNVLMAQLDLDDPLLRSEAIKALHRLRLKFPMLKFEKHYVEQKIFEETRNYYQILTLLYKEHTEHLNGDSETVRKAKQLLIRALEERLDNNLERIFRLLGLKYVARDIYNAYAGLISRKADLRANAIEFLDNILDPGLKRLIIPIVEYDVPQHLIEKSRVLYGSEDLLQQDSLMFLLECEDKWLTSCALYLIAIADYGQYRPHIEAMQDCFDPIVRETVVFALDTLDGRR